MNIAEDHNCLNFVPNSKQENNISFNITKIHFHNTQIAKQHEFNNKEIIQS
jgi:hypothetical protein